MKWMVLSAAVVAAGVVAAPPAHAGDIVCMNFDYYGGTPATVLQLVDYFRYQGVPNKLIGQTIYDSIMDGCPQYLPVLERTRSLYE